MKLFNFFNTNKEVSIDTITSNGLVDLSDYKFVSGAHARFENGVLTNPTIECWRGIRIRSSDNTTFYVTIYNLDDRPSMLLGRVQMTEKPMKIILDNENKIVLRGFGEFKGDVFTPITIPYANYGITLHKANGMITKITAHMHDKNVDIVYEKAENEQRLALFNQCICEYE